MPAVMEETVLHPEAKFVTLVAVVEVPVELGLMELTLRPVLTVSLEVLESIQTSLELHSLELAVEAVALTVAQEEQL
jgi:hypothetical protein